MSQPRLNIPTHTAHTHTQTHTRCGICLYLSIKSVGRVGVEGEWRSKEEDGDEQQDEEEEESSNISKRKRHSELTCFPFSTTMYRTEVYVISLSRRHTHTKCLLLFFFQAASSCFLLIISGDKKKTQRHFKSRLLNKKIHRHKIL